MSDVEARQVRLEKFRFSLAGKLSKVWVDTIVDVENECDWIAYEATGCIFGERLKRHRVVYPADWWQHFKQRWFSTWATKRWPVKFECVEFEAAALYPGFKSSIPGHEVVIALLPKNEEGCWHA
jgi:hypothetical protein